MCMLYHPDKHQDPAKKKVRLKAYALIAPSEILFVLQNNLSTGSHFQSERFFSLAKIFSTVTKVQRCRREDRFGGLQFFVRRQTPLFLDSFPSPCYTTRFFDPVNMTILSWEFCRKTCFGATVVEPFARHLVGFILVGTVFWESFQDLWIA